MRILITGASGFVGPVLSRVIKEKYPDAAIWGTYFLHHELAEIDKAHTIPYYLDISIPDNIKSALTEIQPELIYHLAGQSSVKVSWQKPALTFSVNAIGCINLLECVKMITPDCPILVIGSSEEYGLLNGRAANENDECRPVNPYGLSKRVQEDICHLYIAAHHMHIKMTRSFNHIGPKQAESFVISDWCKQIAEIEILDKEPILYVGNIEVSRDFSHVEDVCKAYIDIMEKGKNGEIYNVGSGTASTLKDILEYLIASSTKNITYKIQQEKLRKAENPIIACDTRKLKEISPESFRPLKSTLLEVLNYWRSKVAARKPY